MVSQAYQTAGISLTGDRANNQDRVAWRTAGGRCLLALADGMGGHAAGDRAAQCLTDAALTHFGAHPGGRRMDAFLADALRDAQHRVRALSTEYPHQRPPATTAVLCVVEGRRACWAHVGDSRLYWFHDGAVTRTRDHSPLEALLQSGAIDAAAARHHPLRNRVGRCVGGFEADVEPEIGTTVTLAPGDVLLLCSDGFWEAFDDAELTMAINAVTTDEEALQAAVSALATQAVARNRPRADNTSLVALRLPL